MSTFLILIVIIIVSLIVYYIADKWEPQLPYKPASRRPRYIGNNIMKICPRCGHVYGSSQSRDFPCVFCEFEYPIKTEFTYAFYVNDLSHKETLEFKRQLRQRYVLTGQNKDLDMEWYNKREDRDYQKELTFQKLCNNSSGSHVPSYACPVCGGTSFTPVRRKWTFMAGYRTNKIDMVCNHCGHVREG